MADPAACGPCQRGGVLIPVTVPASLLAMLEVLRSCFTSPTFETLSWLVTGVFSAHGPRTVTGMWTGSVRPWRTWWWPGSYRSAGR